MTTLILLAVLGATPTPTRTARPTATPTVTPTRVPCGQSGWDEPSDVSKRMTIDMGGGGEDVWCYRCCDCDPAILADGTKPLMCPSSTGRMHAVRCCTNRY